MSTSECIVRVFVVTVIAVSILQNSAKSELRPNNVTAAFSCSPGFVPQGNSCVCGNWPNGIIFCDGDSKNALMQVGHCMTYSNETGEVRAGACLKSFFRNDSYNFYYPLPSDLSDLNDQVCGPFNSKGLLCGECRDGFTVSPPLFLTCINCTGASHGWIRALAVTYLPITVIFIVIITFAISFVSGPINSFIFFGQVTASNFYNIGSIASVLGAQDTFTFSYRTSTITIAAIYDVLSLNIFRYIVPPFCSTNHFTRLQAYALEYIVAFYPLILILFLYICIQLHARNFSPIVYCWKPFLKCFLRIRRSVDPKTSIIDAFATFILLSYVKLLYVTGLFLLPTYLYNGQGHKHNTIVLYESTDIQYFYKEHLPFALLSIFIALIFIALPPIVLILYSTSSFQKCLSRCKLNCQALRTFVETFQGCYKDGTNGTRDCQYFAGLYFVLRIISGLLTIADVSVFVIASSLLYWCTALLFALVQPYKEYIYNITDAITFGLMGTIYLIISFDITHIAFTGHASALVLTDVLYTLPLLYLVVFVVCWMLNRKTNCTQKFIGYKLFGSFFSTITQREF